MGTSNKYSKTTPNQPGRKLEMVKGMVTQSYHPTTLTKNEIGGLL
jgi:hypothetical protein